MASDFSKLLTFAPISEHKKEPRRMPRLGGGGQTTVDAGASGGTGFRGGSVGFLLGLGRRRAVTALAFFPAVLSVGIEDSTAVAAAKTSN